MIRVVAIYKREFKNQTRIRFVCCSNKLKQEVFEKHLKCMTRGMAMRDVVEIFNEKYLYYIDYKLNDTEAEVNWNEYLEILEIYDEGYRGKTYLLNDREKCYSLICKFDTSFHRYLKQELIGERLGYYKDSNWLYYDDKPMCIWQPYYKDELYKRTMYETKEYVRYEDMRLHEILFDGNVRHKTQALGEVLTLNKNTKECVRSLKLIEKDRYIERMQIFNLEIKEWVVLQETQGAYVLGIRK